MRQLSPALPCRRATALIAALSASAFATSACAQERPIATITLTEGGIPHVVAADMSALGFGAGYAAALTDLCGVADAIATYTGRRSIASGADAKTQLHIPLRSQVDNALNDLTLRFSVDDELVQRARRSMSSGYVGDGSRLCRRLQQTDPGSCA